MDNNDGIQIIFMIIFLFLGFIFLLISKVNFENSKNELEQEISMEGMRNKEINKNQMNAFCKNNVKVKEKEKACKVLTENNCKNIDCCVYLSNKKCVGGDIDGPLIHEDGEGNKKNFDYYYYKNKCYGNGCN